LATDRARPSPWSSPPHSILTSLPSSEIPASYPISGDVYFRGTAGTLVATRAFSLTAKATLVLNTASVPSANGVGGAITIAHDGRYGDLAGKAVALEPATGFSFDSALEPRPR
jgi:hypothetical protein